MNTSPRLFISYSWSTPEHEQWVIDLATELINNGVDVTLDKWSLREGQDSVAFMEKMVTDPSISKVILICDHTYASKADGRAGGVGTETQIISAEIYSNQDQSKFVAVIAEKDDAGKPYLPTYYKSRIYIDLCESDRYSENFEKLLRWIFDKPLHVKPEIGKPPSFIVEPNSTGLGTSGLAKRVIEGFKTDKRYVRGTLAEYLTAFSENLERFRIVGGDGERYDWIVKSVEDFSHSRNEFIQVFTTLTQYAADTQLHMPLVHRFFESIIPYLSHPPHINQFYEIDFDNFKFIIHELFLYTLAVLLRGDHFESATYLLSQSYYVGNPENVNNATVSYTVFHKYMKSLEINNKRLNTNLPSLRADLLEQRSKSSGVQFRHVMQADFICFFRADLTKDRWWPETLLYAKRHYGPFELFARSTSKAYLTRTLTLLGVSNLEEIRAMLDEYAGGKKNLPHWNHYLLNPAILIGFEQLGTKV